MKTSSIICFFVVLSIALAACDVIKPTMPAEAKNAIDQTITDMPANYGKALDYNIVSSMRATDLNESGYDEAWCVVLDKGYDSFFAFNVTHFLVQRSGKLWKAFMPPDERIGRETFSQYGCENY